MTVSELQRLITRVSVARSDLLFHLGNIRHVASADAVLNVVGAPKFEKAVLHLEESVARIQAAIIRFRADNLESAIVAEAKEAYANAEEIAKAEELAEKIRNRGA